MNQKTRIISIFIITIFLIIITSNCVFADIADPIANPDVWKPGVFGTDTVDTIKTTSGKILGLVQNIGIIVGVIALSVMGLKYMLGSVDEKATYKQSMLPYFIGVVVLMAGATLVNVLYSLGQSI